MLFEVVVGGSAVVTGISALGALRYIRQTRQDAKDAVTLLRGTDAGPGVIGRLDEVEVQSDKNAERSARNRRMLRCAGIIDGDNQNGD